MSWDQSLSGFLFIAIFFGLWWFFAYVNVRLLTWLEDQWRAFVTWYEAGKAYRRESVSNPHREMWERAKGRR